MAERSHSISKLKRKKLSVDEPRTETHSKNAPQKNNSPLCFDGTTELHKSTTRPADPTVKWWNRSDLCALENLWALTLKCALSSLDTHDECGSVVPDLPMASSAVTPTAADQLGKWRWPGLGEEVPPFPDELSNAIPGPSPPPDPPCVDDATPEEVHLPANEGQSPHPCPVSPPPSPPGEDDPQQSTAAGTSRGFPCPKRHGTPDNRGRATSSKASQQRKSSERAPCRVLAKSRPASSIKEGQTSMQSWMKVPPPPPPQHPGVTASNKRRGTGAGGDGDSLTRVTKRPAAPACQREDSDSCPPLQQGRAGVDERSLEGKAVPSGSSGEGSGGERLQSCPMCLVAFPAGFVQMDVDSHLAQCLSEMTMDMTW